MRHKLHCNTVGRNAVSPAAGSASGSRDEGSLPPALCIPYLDCVSAFAPSFDLRKMHIHTTSARLRVTKLRDKDLAVLDDPLLVRDLGDEGLVLRDGDDGALEVLERLGERGDAVVVAARRGEPVAPGAVLLPVAPLNALLGAVAGRAIVARVLALRLALERELGLLLLPLALLFDLLRTSRCMCRCEGV